MSNMIEKYTVSQKVKMLKRFVAKAHKCEIYGADLLDAIYSSPHLNRLSMSTVCLIAFNNVLHHGEFFEKLQDAYYPFITRFGRLLPEDDFVFDIEHNVRVTLGKDNVWRAEKKEGYSGYA